MSDVPAVVRMGHDLVRHMGPLHGGDAATEIATHMKKFWDPRMRQQLLSLVREGRGDIEPLLVDAARHVAEGDIDREEIREPSGG